MNVPAIAKKTFEKFRSSIECDTIFKFILSHLQQTPDKSQRARFVHDVVDKFNVEVFAHPLVKKFSPCKSGCTGCCHTQVSVTSDEAHLLAQRVKEGVSIDLELLKLQMKAGDSSELFKELPYAQRRCVFLSESGTCKIYEDRPSVCRTNAVLGEASQCDTSVTEQPLVLVITKNADIAIYSSFVHSKENGSLPHLLGKLLL